MDSVCLSSHSECSDISFLNTSLPSTNIPVSAVAYNLFSCTSLGPVFSKQCLLSQSRSSFSAFLQKFDIWPMLVRVDYSPCHVDLTALRGGKYVELVNLIPWKVTC